MNKTMPTGQPFDDYLTSVSPERRQQEARVLDPLFRAASGYDPVVWAGGIIGYGAYRYRYASGREGVFLATGFSPRKAGLSIYIMPGYADFGEMLKRLGPHKMGKSCLTLARLDRVDPDILRDLIDAGLQRLRQMWPVASSVSTLP